MFKGILKKIFGESKSGYDPSLRGYQPNGKNKLDSKNPPRGGSGLTEGSWKGSMSKKESRYPSKRERWSRPLKEGYNPPPREKRPKPPPPPPMTMKGGFDENIPLKEVNLNIGKQGQIIITGRR